MNLVRQREPRLELPALTRTARDRECTILVPDLCLWLLFRRTDTTVWAHSNWSDHGKGARLKAHDCFGAFACQACHDWLDRTRDPRRREFFDRGRDRTLYILFRENKLRAVP